MSGKTAKGQTSFLDEARVVVSQTLADYQKQTEDYVPRILVREGASRQEISESRSYRQLGMPVPEQMLIDHSEITSFPRMALIGNAGSGKTYAVRHAYLGAAETFLLASDTPMPCLLNLERHLSTRRGIEEALDRRYRDLFGRLSSEHEPGCVLFLDGLDDRLRTEPNHFDFVNSLLCFLADHSNQLSSVVLACRRPYWNPSWVAGSEPPWAVYHTDFLDPEDYIAILPDPATLRKFFDHAESLGIADLLQLPFIGFDLARRYRRGEELPSSRQEWFRQRIQTSLKGTERDQKRAEAPPLDTLLIRTQFS